MGRWSVFHISLITAICHSLITVSELLHHIVDFAAAGLAASDFLCPDAFSLKLTEIRLGNYTNGDNIYFSRFVEFYNDGGRFELSQNDLKFSGLLSSDAFGSSARNECNITVEKGQYIVFYDPSMDLPECPDCNCTLNATTIQCEDAIYVPCDSDPATSGCGACTWNTLMVCKNDAKCTCSSLI